MRWGPMYEAFVSLGQQTPIRLKLYALIGQPSIRSTHASQYLFQGELAHRIVKRLYSRTNKKNAIKQIAKNERRSVRLRRAREAAAAPRNHHLHHIPFTKSDPLPYTSIDQHHHMSDSRNHPLNLMSFVNEPAGDPAKKVRLLSMQLFRWSPFPIELYTQTQEPFTWPPSRSLVRW